MNVVKVYGGLGNQLFQYAFGRAQMENGFDVGFNINWFNRSKNANRPYVLDKFNTKVKTSDYLPQKNILEKRVKYNPNLTDVTSFNFHGYWQNPKYFESIFPILRKEFKLKKDSLHKYFEGWKNKILSENSVSIHVRRGDFVGKVNILSMQYYLNAQSLFCSIVPPQKFEYFIFSDDIEWCASNFGNGYCYIYLDEWNDFELMRLCKHNIIANSTFSWWAAMLNDNPNKIVVAPKQWRLTEEAQKEISSEFLHPTGWIIL